MTTVIGVSFKRAGKMYYFDPNGLEIHMGDQVIVETARGMECGDAVTEIREVSDEEIVQPLKTVIRVATEEDKKRIELNLKKESEAFVIGQQRIAQHELEMKLVDVEYTFDVSKIIFYFTANGRIDFRELVKDLASIFKTRIELRQIGVRDEAKMLGGLGACGRPICCRTFLGDFEPVSIKMAKEQNLLLNPTKISGLCGRLMCCLKYEQDNYDEVYHRVPRVGKEVLTPDGPGIVSEIAVIREKIKVKSINKEGVQEFKEYPFDQVILAPKDGSPVVFPEKEEEKDTETINSEINAEDIVDSEESSVKSDANSGEKKHNNRPRGSRGGRGRQRSGDRNLENAENGEKTGTSENGGKNNGSVYNSRPPRQHNHRSGEKSLPTEGEGIEKNTHMEGGNNPSRSEHRRRRPPRREKNDRSGEQPVHTISHQKYPQE